MASRRFSTGTVVAFLLVFAISALAAHAHHEGASHDGCLCQVGSCPDPGGLSGNAVDRPRPRFLHTTAPQVQLAAVLAADPVVRRGPPAA